MFTAASNKLNALGKDERGTVAMIFAISLFALIMVLGLAIDVARAMHTKMKISTALDAAALASAKSLHDGRLANSEITALARRFFDANIGDAGPNFGSIGGFSVAIDRDKSTVTISANADVPTVFARVGGIDSLRFPTVSAAAFNPKDIELALSLDVTGSMCNPCSKIDDLKLAARDMVDILLPANKANSNKIRVALAPFSAGVDAGPFFTLATNKSKGGDGCVFERDGADQASDAAPGGGAYLKIAGDKGVATTRNNCPSGAEVTALTDDGGALRTAIERLRSGGTTAGHLGTAWAWYLVSPKWALVWPSASRPVEYGDKKTIKAVVLMTDGVYNTFGGSCDRNCTNVSTQANNSQDMARKLCEAMRKPEAGVKVYSVAFMLDDPLAEKVLADCAADSKAFFRAENGEALRDAFRLIAEDLMRLRLSE